MLIIINHFLLTAVKSFISWNQNIFTMAFNSYRVVYQIFNKINELYTDIFFTQTLIF